LKFCDFYICVADEEISSAEYVEAMFSYTSTNTVMSNGYIDVSYEKGDIFLVLEKPNANWYQVFFLLQ
jgi:hypothetical protein